MTLRLEGRSVSGDQFRAASVRAVFPRELLSLPFHRTSRRSDCVSLPTGAKWAEWNATSDGTAQCKHLVASHVCGTYPNRVE